MILMYLLQIASLSAPLANELAVDVNLRMCLEDNARERLKSHIYDATPEIIIDEVLPICNFEIRAKAESQLGLSVSEREVVATRENVRSIMIEEIDRWLSAHKLSEIRMELTSLALKDCEKVSTIKFNHIILEQRADMILDSCSLQINNLARAFVYSVKSKGVDISFYNARDGIYKAERSRIRSSLNLK